MAKSKWRKRKNTREEEDNEDEEENDKEEGRCTEGGIGLHKQNNRQSLKRKEEEHLEEE